jgi:hypothetical protein
MKKALLSSVGFAVLGFPLAAAAQPASDFLCTTNGNAITITCYLGPSGAVTIPSTINNLPVTSIGASAFLPQYDVNITSVSIPEGVTNIGAGAFSDCNYLTAVALPSSLLAIGALAFAGSGLTNVTLPGGLVTIGPYAFEYCTALTSITIPRSVTTIGGAAFAGCADLPAIDVDPANASFTSLDGVLFDRAQSTLYQWPAAKSGSYTVPGTVTEILVRAFLGASGLTAVTMLDGVATVGDEAFCYCVNLTNVSFSSTVTDIGLSQFRYCSNLTAIAVDPRNPCYSSRDGVLFDRAQATLIECPGGRSGSYVVPPGVTTIGRGADEGFYGCAGLAYVTIPASVTNIALGSFANCFAKPCILFLGEPPAFQGGYINTVYYVPGAPGWGTSFAGAPVVLWNPISQAPSVWNDQFGFEIIGAPNLPFVLEASTNLVGGNWIPLQTATLTNGLLHVHDPAWTNYPARFYRLRWP